MNEINIIEQVNSFYNSAWEKLIIVGTIALGIVGIITPVIIQWYQKRTLKLNEESLRETLRKEVENSKLQLKLEVEEIINKELKKYRKILKRKVRKLRGDSEGGIYYIQANYLLDEKQYFDAINSYVNAIDYYRKSGNFVTIKEILPLLIECLTKNKKEDISELKENGLDIDEVLTKVLNKDKYGVVRNIILDEIYSKFEFLNINSTKKK